MAVGTRDNLQRTMTLGTHDKSQFKNQVLTVYVNGNLCESGEDVGEYVARHVIAYSQMYIVTGLLSTSVRVFGIIVGDPDLSSSRGLVSCPCGVTDKLSEAVVLGLRWATAVWGEVHCVEVNMQNNAALIYRNSPGDKYALVQITPAGLNEFTKFAQDVINLAEIT